MRWFAWQLWRSSTSRDRKSTRLNSSHQIISYAVFCLKKKKNVIVLDNINIVGTMGRREIREKFRARGDRSIDRSVITVIGRVNSKLRRKISQSIANVI